MDKNKIFLILSQKLFLLPVVLVPLIHIVVVFQAINQSEYPKDTSEIALAIILILLITFPSYFLLKLLLKDKIKAAVASTLFLGVSFSFGLINQNLFQLNSFENLSEKLFFGNIIIASISLLTITFILIASIILFLPFKLNRLNNYLAILFSLFLFYEIYTYFSYAPKTIKLEEEITLPQESRQGDKALPNIYYIVFDSYTNFESLEKYWNFDNSGLKYFLQNRGFYVAPKSKSNYNQTHFAMASALNLSYLDFKLFDKLTLAHYPYLFKLIKENALVRILEKNGYEIINYSLFDISKEEKYYRFEITDAPNFFTNTLFEGLINTNFLGIELGLNLEPELNIIQTNLNIKNLLMDVPKRKTEQNFFVYAHFMLPHPPYFFDADGNQMSYEYSKDHSNQWKYLEQLKFANKIIKEVVDSILINSSEAPVIIIQGDHGFRFLKDDIMQAAESHTILNAFYFPSKDYSALYPSISAVNTFRVLLNKYNFLEIENLPNEIFYVAKGIKLDY
ncbi:MAG: hypothetical protein C0425_08725 [Chlorobiaceae bacterium]|nr:hypothetical protein [Chlorobiaceae bacterium]MBA4310405.1 hypothetical protein [Chlorobiaceae bacterium]